MLNGVRMMRMAGFQEQNQSRCQGAFACSDKIIKINMFIMVRALSSTVFPAEWREIWCERSALSDEWFQRVGHLSS